MMNRYALEVLSGHVVKFDLSLIVGPSCLVVQEFRLHHEGAHISRSRQQNTSLSEPFSTSPARPCRMQRSPNSSTNRTCSQRGAVTRVGLQNWPGLMRTEEFLLLLTQKLLQHFGTLVCPMSLLITQDRRRRRHSQQFRYHSSEKTNGVSVSHEL